MNQHCRVKEQPEAGLIQIYRKYKQITTLSNLHTRWKRFHTSALTYRKVCRWSPLQAIRYIVKGTATECLMHRWKRFHSSHSCPIAHPNSGWNVRVGDRSGSHAHGHGNELRPIGSSKMNSSMWCFWVGPHWPTHTGQFGRRASSLTRIRSLSCSKIGRGG
jgi:hypothetical protein